MWPVSRLVATNIGVELAQVAILLGAWIVTMRWQSSRLYQKARFAANLLIGGIALWWFFTRISGM